MPFKQLTFYRIADTLPTPDIIAAKLAEYPFSPCLGLDWFSEGFAPILPDSGSLTCIAGNTLGFILHREEKVLPPSLISAKVDETVRRIAQAEHRPVGKRERHEIRERVVDALLPQALAKPSRTYAVIDYARSLLLVNAAPKAAENLLAKLREALGGLAVRLPETRRQPAHVMTEWLAEGEATEPFELGDSGTFKHTQCGAKITAAKENLTDNRIAGLLQGGKTVRELGLIWRGQVAFSLTDKLALRRIKFADQITEEVKRQGDDADTLFRAEQLIQAETLTALIGDWAEAAGGWIDDVE